jgi:putative DNA primase/helicase
MAPSAADIAAALGGARKSGDSWMARCPAHNDRNPSLTLTERNGRLLVHCFAGCEQSAVIAALKERALWPEAERREAWIEWRPGVRYPGKWGRITREYVYRAADGRAMYSTFRLEPKSFRQGYQDPSGKWIWRKHVKQLPYRLPEVLQSEICFVCEGEKDCDVLTEWGFTATCNAAGAGKWRPEWGPYFSGKTVFIVPDNDEPGWQHARLVAASLREHARLVAILPLPFGKDASDYFAMGGSEVWICETVERLLTGAEGGRHAA